MDNYLGESRILYILIQGAYLPIACLSDNPFSETSEMLPTTTRDNLGWATSRPTMQSYNIAFNGLQVNSTETGGYFNVASYDKLKVLKRDKVLVDWKIQGTFPVVDYGKAYITDLSEGNAVGEFLSFSGSLTGYGKPFITSLPDILLNNGFPTFIIQDGLDNLIQI